ncbi:MAG: hypothetical protein V3W41_04335 [Planctomycetota bacterium]
MNRFLVARSSAPVGERVRLVANLEAELEWCLESNGHAAPPRGLRRPSPEILDFYGAAMAILGQAGDEIWLPGGGRDLIFGPAFESLDIQVVSGYRPAAKATATLSWAQTLAATRLSGASLGEEDRERLAAIRKLSARDAIELGDLETSLAAVETLLELRSGLVALCEQNPAQSWVAKARWSGAGRLRQRGRGQDLGEADKLRLHRLLELSGRLILEPWVNVEAEFGAVGEVRKGEVILSSLHKSSTRGGAAPAALQLLGVKAPAAGSRAMTTSEHQLLVRAFDNEGERLRQTGYVGPFGIDAWRWRSSDGGLHFRAPAERNLRWTMGHLAAAWVARFESSELFQGPSALRARERPVFCLGGPAEEGDLVVVRRAQGDATLRISWSFTSDNMNPDD